MDNVETSERRLLTKAEFCSRYGVGHTKFYELINTGALQVLKLGTKTLVAEDEALRWMASLPSYRPRNLIG